ncbi:Cobalt-zinc-cadmium resistance protein CzcA; Cation efflux system protein CusA [hydrothermal vent metagenome]|uniref:Cobalt-zinc-cadmium resistance protein CzcA Cation efflux system protein CusA n=1 Tax=hydrothermal vent metagenome TaxID=652676 RepID=A0A3B0Z2I7_9ZZZZ
MIEALIRWSVCNRSLVLIAALLLTGLGIYSVQHIPLDAIPDFSDVQVIIKTSYPGQAPQVVEDQVTYPLSTAMLAVPGALAVRGYSFFGDSFVYVIFQDGTDPYWARSRVLEYLSQIAPQLPDAAQTALGPDASGVGWVYEYALLDRTGRHDLSQLRSLQDWFLKFELQTVPGVAEVATVGGMVKQYQIVLDPNRLRVHSLSLTQVKNAILTANKETGGSVIEMAEAEYIVRSRGYIQSEEDIRQIPPLGLATVGSTFMLSEVAEIRTGPQMRRGIAELDGEGEVVGGIVIMRYGENALATINAVKEKIEQLRKSLPEGVELVETYDRSGLITRAVDTLKHRLIEEFIVVVLVCALFLFHFRSSLVILISLPVGILAAFVLMRLQGVNANIMSLGGIAIAIGAMVDAAIVMIENTHKRLEQAGPDCNRIAVIQKAAVEVGPPLFFSLLIITLSFLPVFALEAQEGRLFAPLAFTKTYAMAAAAGISITLIPALLVFLIRGSIRKEEENPVNRFLINLYRPLIRSSLKKPGLTLILVLMMVLSAAWPLSQLGSEFMPELDEGDLLYMPTTFPGISVGKARELLQQTDKLIKTVPEVERVFGKVGRAETATDPAPLTMIETTVRLKPRDQWRPGMTLEKLKQELNKKIQFPGMNNAWLMPIKTRIDMQTTGINTPVGIKISGPDLDVIQSIGKQLEPVIQRVSGTDFVYSERTNSARYIDIDIDRRAAGRYLLSISEIQDVIDTAVGGLNVTSTVEGRERYPINIRYPRHFRDSVEKLRDLPIITTREEQIQLRDVAKINIVDGPAIIKSENARLNGWVYITINDRDLGSYVAEAQKAVSEQVELPAGYTLSWSGQYEYLVRARDKLILIVPVTLTIILLLLYLTFRNFVESFMVLGAVPLALVGGFWLLYILGYHLSVAAGVGFIALAGVAAEFGVVMLVYLNEAVRRRQPATFKELREAVIEGAVLRVRPKAMTAIVIIAGLLPIMLGAGTGSEMMRRIAAPMVGGMLTAPLVSMFLIPVLYLLWKGVGFSKR